ncbi:hypothetical protein [Thermosipho sp. 1074]|uniref:hypothetical protein n=1 Tax=Thermosipho sp. 1074 TaxID=1643331 RepID=UPI00098441D2|nr:hypothetical protein [Thermosipho sp. 1074]OOC42629.1 hypothetical protein XO08_06040 [Thermosipho sp. 1074]
MRKVVLFFLLFSITFFGEFLMLYPEHGLLVKNISDGFILPEKWRVESIQGSFHVKDIFIDEKLKYVPNIKGNFVYKDGKFVSNDGKEYKIIDGYFFEITQHPKVVKKIFLDTKKATATFLVDGRYSFSYILNENVLSQFLNIYADVDRAFVFVVSEPQQNRWLMKGSGETNIQGKKVYQLGEIEDLRNERTILIDRMKVERLDYNYVELYDYVTNWNPTKRMVYIKTLRQLPAGKITVWSKLYNRYLPLDQAYLPDTNEEIEIFLGYSWNNWYKWNVKTSLNLGNRKRISGELSLKGRGVYKIKIFGKNIGSIKTNVEVIEKNESYIILLAHNTQTIFIEYEKDKN